MLPAAQRLTDASSYRETARRGSRASSRSVVVHLAVAPSSTDGAAAARVGFVVSKAVGNSVVRNRVKRRLRHLMRSRLAELPDGAAVVVRALPASAAASSVALGADLDRCLSRCARSAS